MLKCVARERIGPAHLLGPAFAACPSTHEPQLGVDGRIGMAVDDAEGKRAPVGREGGRDIQIEDGLCGNGRSGRYSVVVADDPCAGYLAVGLEIEMRYRVIGYAEVLRTE